MLPRCAAPQDAAHEIGNVLAVGDGAVRYREIFEAGGSEVAGPGDMWPSPLAVAEMGMERVGGEVFEAGSLPAPLYLRQADVRIGWDQVDGRVGGPAGPPPAEPKMAR